MMRVQHWVAAFLIGAAAACAGVESPRAIDKELIEAMWRGNPDQIRGVLDRGADPNARNDQGHTPLMMAAIFSDNPDERVVEIIQLLLDRKADPNAADNYGRTPLRAMIEYKRVPAARALIKGGAKVDYIPPSPDGYSKMSALMEACEDGSEEAVDMLLADGADPALAGQHGQTALDWTLGKHPALTRKLVAKGGKRFAAALPRAAEAGDAEAVKLLLEAGVEPDAPARDRMSSLARAAGKGHTEVVKLLLARGADPEGALHLAAQEGRTETVRAMIEAKVDVDAAGGRGGALMQAVEKGSAEIVKMIIEAGVDLEDRYTGNWRALHIAARKGDLETVKMMVARKARLDWHDGPDGKTPLIEAAAAGHLEVARALLDAGAKVGLANDPGPPGCVGGPELVGPPLAWAEKKGHAAVAALLKEHGAK